MLFVNLNYRYNTFAKNEELEKLLNQPSKEEEDTKDEEESEESEDEYKNGFTIKGAASLFSEDAYAHKNIKPKRVKPINEDKYFNAITRMKPDCFLKKEDKSNFFYERVGRPLQHYKGKIYTLTYKIKFQILITITNNLIITYWL